MPFAADHCMIAVVLQDLGELSYVGTDTMINTEEARMRQEKQDEAPPLQKNCRLIKLTLETPRDPARSNVQDLFPFARS